MTHAEEGWLTISAQDPSGQLRSEIVYAPGGQGGLAQAGLVLSRLARPHPGLRIANAMKSNDGGRIVFDGFYSNAAGEKREFRCWVTNQQGHFTCSRIEAPEGRLAESKPMLLSILANVRLMKGTFSSGAGIIRGALFGRPKIFDITGSGC